jgi:hypothetical protein
MEDLLTNAAPYAGAMAFVMYLTQIVKPHLKKLNLGQYTAFLPLVFGIVWFFFLAENSSDESVTTGMKISSAIKLWIASAGTYIVGEHTTGKLAEKYTDGKSSKK